MPFLQVQCLSTRWRWILHVIPKIFLQQLRMRVTTTNTQNSTSHPSLDDLYFLLRLYPNPNLITFLLPIQSLILILLEVSPLLMQTRPHFLDTTYTVACCGWRAQWETSDVPFSLPSKKRYLITWDTVSLQGFFIRGKCSDDAYVDLVLCGHSLGAGVAAILGLVRFPFYSICASS